jgi:hypothetical protein
MTDVVAILQGSAHQTIGAQQPAFLQRAFVPKSQIPGPLPLRLQVCI